MTKHRRRGTSAAGPRPRRGAPRRSRRPRGHVSEKQNIALLTRELSAALEQQAATSEVLRVIASSPDELEPVFAIILTNATQLCEGNFAALWQYDGEALVGAAQHNVSPGFAKLCRSTKLRLGRRPASSSPCSSRCWRTRCVSAKQSSACCIGMMESCFTLRL